MAPEQIRNASEVDLRADIWAFGVVAFECLTGRPPFTGESLIELFERIDSGLHASAHFLEPAIPAAFDAWFDVACAPDPSKRFSNASVAWKQLVVALDLASGQSLSLSGGLSGGFDFNAASGERHKSDVLERSHDGREFKSLQRIPMRNVLPPTPGRSDAPSSFPMASSLADRTLNGRGRSVRRWMLGAAAASVVASLVVWRWLTPAATPSPVPPTLSAAVSAPSSAGEAAAPTYRVEVTSTPSDVGVYGNGQLLGRTPLVTSVAGSSTMHLELVAPGYEPYSRDLVVTHEVELVAVLTPTHAPPDTSSARPRATAPQPPTKLAAPVPTSTASSASAALTVASAVVPSTPSDTPPPAPATPSTPPPARDPLGDRQ